MVRWCAGALAAAGLFCLASFVGDSAVAQMRPGLEPLRVVISPRTLKTASAEVKLRREKAATILPLEGVVEKLRGMLFPQ